MEAYTEKNEVIWDCHFPIVFGFFSISTRLGKLLRKRKVYETLLDLAYELGLDTDGLSNMQEAAARMLKQWSGVKEDLHSS